MVHAHFTIPDFRSSTVFCKRLKSCENAYDAINSVRNRAGLDDLPEGLSTSDFREAVYLERRWELAFEGHRWFDLKRTGRLMDRIHAVISPSVPETHLVFPLPQPDIDRNPNLNQNPGY